jgi:X-X-X-Leu-X-X-Gly heptad repeat protein
MKSDDFTKEHSFKPVLTYRTVVHPYRYSINNMYISTVDMDSETEERLSARISSTLGLVWSFLICPQEHAYREVQPLMEGTSGGGGGDGGGGVMQGAEQVAEGAQQVAQGAQQVAQGAKQLAQGAGQVAHATEQAAQAAEQVAGGADQVARGAQQVTQGADQVAEGADQVAQGADQVAQGADQVVQGAKQQPHGAGQVVPGPEKLGQDDQGEKDTRSRRIKEMCDEILVRAQRLLSQANGMVEESKQSVPETDVMVMLANDLTVECYRLAECSRRIREKLLLSREMAEDILDTSERRHALKTKAEQLIAGVKEMLDAINLFRQYMEGTENAPQDTAKVDPGLKEAGQDVQKEGVVSQVTDKVILTLFQGNRWSNIDYIPRQHREQY